MIVGAKKPASMSTPRITASARRFSTAANRFWFLRHLCTLRTPCWYASSSSFDFVCSRGAAGSVPSSIPDPSTATLARLRPKIRRTKKLRGPSFGIACRLPSCPT